MAGEMYKIYIDDDELEIGDEVLYYVFSRRNDLLRIGKIIDIKNTKKDITFYIIRPSTGGRILSRREEDIYKLESIEQLKQNIIQRRNNGNRD